MDAQGAGGLVPGSDSRGVQEGERQGLHRLPPGSDEPWHHRLAQEDHGEMEGSAIGIRSLFELKLAAKVPNVHAINLIMDEEAERIFKDYKLDILLAGGVLFQDERILRAKARAARLQRLKPWPSTRSQLETVSTEAEEVPAGLNNLTVSEENKQKTIGMEENPVDITDSPGSQDPGRTARKELSWSEMMELAEQERTTMASLSGGAAATTPAPTATTAATAATASTSGVGAGAGPTVDDMDVDKEELDELNETGQELMDASYRPRGQAKGYRTSRIGRAIRKS